MKMEYLLLYGAVCRSVLGRAAERLKAAGKLTLWPTRKRETHTEGVCKREDERGTQREKSILAPKSAPWTERHATAAAESEIRNAESRYVA